MSFSVSAPGPVPNDYGLLLGGTNGECSVPCTCERILFHSIVDV
jgi:hypothetical protein